MDRQVEQGSLSTPRRYWSLKAAKQIRSISLRTESVQLVFTVFVYVPVMYEVRVAYLGLLLE